MEQTFKYISYWDKNNQYQNRIIKISVFIILIPFLLLSCRDREKSNHNTITGIMIGDQVWAAKNLDIAIFRNGDSIPQVRSNEEWEKAGKEGKPAWCYYKNDTSIGRKYGRMYNWYAVNDQRGLCPEGWDIPTNDEWI